MYSAVKYRVLAGLLLAFSALAGAADNRSHAGPVITVQVQRGAEQLPMARVDHLHRGDRLLVTADRSGVAQGAWLVLLALAVPHANQVTSQRYALTDGDTVASIDITDDQQIPIIVIAPQVKTFFGLGTSFNQSADLIADAISADPQRFIDLQKIDQIDNAIATLKSGLDALVQKLQPADAIDATKTMAAKFGATSIDPDCLKGGVVDTRCVATSIVSNQDLKSPSLVELGSIAQPFVNNALSPDMLANVRLVAATSAFLANKYRDQYDFAPSSAQRDKDGGKLRLFSNGNFKGGDIKTAYVYVPSWYAGEPPQLRVDSQPMRCLAAGSLHLSVQGPLPLGNYWHDWSLRLRAAGASDSVLQLDALQFNPETGTMDIDLQDHEAELAQHGEQLTASLTGKYAFDAVTLPDFTVALPSSADLSSRLSGLESLVAGDKVQLRFAPEAVDVCVQSLRLTANTTELQAQRASADSGIFEFDLKDLPAGDAVLEITQVGAAQQSFPVRILQRRAHLARLEHFDQEPVLHASGENLDRIDVIQLGADSCVATDAAAPARSSRNFVCPDAWSDNADLPKQATIHYLQQEPQPEKVRLKLSAARPLVALGSSKTALLAVLSPNAYRWGLELDDALVSSDSGLSVQLTPLHGNKLARGSYSMQLRFADDPVTEQNPISVFLMADYVHNELRTRRPVDFKGSQLPNIVNPLQYRVLQQPSGLASDWKPLPRALVSLPAIGNLECDAKSQGLLIHGSQLDQIDWASNDLALDRTPADTSGASFAKLSSCADGLCLRIPQLAANGHLKVKVHWIDDRVFEVSFPPLPSCQAD